MRGFFFCFVFVCLQYLCLCSLSVMDYSKILLGPSSIVLEVGSADYESGNGLNKGQFDDLGLGKARGGLVALDLDWT